LLGGTMAELACIRTRLNGPDQQDREIALARSD
jgi:hypothetical protein